MTSEDSRNVFLLFSIQLFAAFVGGIFAGSGQRFGLLLGVFVGLWNGVLAALLRQNPTGELVALGFFTQPLFQSGTALLGGMIGSTVWRPIIQMPTATLAPTTKKAAKRSAPLLAGEIAWVRVLLGCVAVIGATLYASKLLDKILELTGNRFGTGDDLQDQIITWQVKGILILLGALIAGATTKNGLKQGLIVGAFSSAILVGMRAPGTSDLPRMLLLTVPVTLGLSLLGGWFGGQLFPPIMSRKRATSGTPSW